MSCSSPRRMPGMGPVLVACWLGSNPDGATLDELADAQDWDEPELSDYLTWLQEHDYIELEMGRYRLTDRGRDLRAAS